MMFRVVIALLCWSANVVTPATGSKASATEFESTWLSDWASRA